MTSASYTVGGVLAHKRQPAAEHISVHRPVDETRVGSGRDIENRIANPDDLSPARGEAIEHTERRQVAEVDDEIAPAQRVGGGVGKIAPVRELAMCVRDQADDNGRIRFCRRAHDRLLGRWTMWTADRGPSRSIVATVGPEPDNGMVGLPGLTSSVAPARATFGTWLVPLERDVDIGAEEDRRIDEIGQVGGHADERVTGTDQQGTLVQSNTVRRRVDGGADRQNRRERCEAIENAQ